MGPSTISQITRSPAHQIGRICRNSLLAIGMAVGLAACSGGEDEENAPVRPVKIIEVSTGTDVRTQSLPAVIEAARSSDLTFEINGTLQELLVREGDNVRQGQVLARLDPRTYQNDLATAQAEYNNANAEYERASRLVAEDAIAQNVYEQRRTAREVARAQFDTARVRLDDTIIRAPFSGVVARTYVERFENIGAQQEILTLQTQGQARAVVQVPATIVANSGQLRPLGSVMTLDAAPEVEIPATIYSTATQADPSSQTFEVRFNFTPPADTLILPGMTGTVRARLELEEGGIVPEGVSIPLAAVLSDGDDRYVWLVDDDAMTVSRRDIVVASANGELMTVTSGLQRGDKIVGAGASYLHEGMEIRPYEE